MKKRVSKISAFTIVFALVLNSLLPVFANLKLDAVNLSIPEYDNVNWSNGAIKNVTVNVDFKDNTTENKKVEFTLPDGMKFVSVPVQNNYVIASGVDANIISKLGSSDPLSNAIISTNVPKKESGFYDTSTFGKVIYSLSAGTERAAFTFAVRVDATKYYGETDLKDKIKAEAFMDGASIGSKQKNIHASGKVVGYANQDSVQTMFRNWYPDNSLSSGVTASTDSENSYNYTRTYSLVNGLNNADDRGSRSYLAKKVTATLYYPKEMEFFEVVDLRKNPVVQSDTFKVTNFPSEGKVLLEYQPMYDDGGTRSFAIKYKIPVGTSNGTYTADKIPSAIIETYDGTIFTTDALVASTTDQSPVAPDFSKVVDKGPNQMEIGKRDFHINPDSYSWAGMVRVTNTSTAGTKNNQMYNVTLDSNWEAKTVNLPFDNSISGNKITEIQYKTNLNSNFRNYTRELLASGYQAKLDAVSVGLADNEYFTEVQANVGSFSTGYISYNPNGDLDYKSTVSYGKVKNGVTSVTFDASIWDKNDEAGTKVSATSSYRVSNNISSASTGYLNFYNKDGTYITNSSAGETITAGGFLSLYDYPYGTRTEIENPTIYLREMDGLTINPSSIKLQDTSNGSEILFDIEETTDLKGEKVYALKTKDIKVGALITYPIKSNFIKFSYDFSTKITMQNDMNIDAQQMIAWGGPNIQSSGTSNAFSDRGIDINGNGIQNEYLLGVKINPLSISKLDTVIVETFLSVIGEDPKGEYVEGNDDTVAYFTPGTDADYTVKISNNSINPAPNYTMYVPIPKAGQDFGKSFQDGPFKWNMKLGGPVILTGMSDLFDVTYSSNATKNNFNSSANYVANPNYETVNMVKISNKKPIDGGAKIEFKIPLKVDETFDSANAGNKIATRNAYNPRYEVTTTNFAGMLSGTKVGTELVIAEIGGIIFNDLNSNGIYDTGDTPITNHQVLLYKYNDITKIYEPVMSGGTQVKASSNVDGIYLFDYAQGLGYGKYGVKFTTKAGGTFEYTAYQTGLNKAIDSDAIVSGTDKGMALDIDATRLEAKTIGAGYLKYDPPVDLKVNIDTKEVEVGKSVNINIPKVEETGGETAEDTIQPSFFDAIKDNAQGYVWNIGDNSLATVTTNPDGSATITGVSTGTGSPTLVNTTITLTIKDIYGTTKSSTAPLIIKNADENVTTEELIVGANNIVIENADAKNQTLDTLKNNSKVKLLQKIKVGINTNINDVTNLITIPTIQLNEMKNAGLTGGVYPLTFKTADNGIEVTVKFIVKPLNPTVTEDLSIDALNYNLSNKDAKKETDVLAKQHSQVKAFLLNSGVYIDETTNISINQQELKAINDVGPEGGVYPLTFTTTDATTRATISKTINITIATDFEPVINGVTNKEIFVGEDFNASTDISVSDVEDSDIVIVPEIIGVVNTNLAGEYIITYKATDSDANETYLNATITVKPRQIVFNSNTGTGIMDAQIFNSSNTQAINSNSFQKAGHTFTGWNTQADGDGTAYPNNSNFAISDFGVLSEVILYAQFELSPVTPSATEQNPITGTTGILIIVLLGSFAVITTLIFRKRKNS